MPTDFTEPRSAKFCRGRPMLDSCALL